MASAIKPDALIEVAGRVRAGVLRDERACRVVRHRHLGSFANVAAEEWVAG